VLHNRSALIDSKRQGDVYRFASLKSADCILEATTNSHDESNIDEALLGAPFPLTVRAQSAEDLNEAESPVLEVLAKCLGFGRNRWYLPRSLPVVELLSGLHCA
jgi:hypothetical protein